MTSHVFLLHQVTREYDVGRARITQDVTESMPCTNVFKERESMNDIVRRRAELLVENKALLHKAFLFEDGLLTAVAGAAFAERNRIADPELVKECREILRKKKGPFSEIRGNNELIVSTKMAISGNPEQYLDDVIEVYKRLQSGKIFGSSYRVLAATTICDAKRANDVEKIVEKTEAILKGMKASHPFLTSDEDTGFAVLLAMTDKSVEQILTELEESFIEFKVDFVLHDNAAYSLAQVLTTFEGDSKEKSKKAVELFEAFKDAGYSYGKDYELPSLGILVNLGKETGDVVSEVIEVVESFKGKKGFGIFEMTPQTKLMLGTMIVGTVYGENQPAANASVTSGAISILIAQQVMMVTLIAAMATISATSN